MAYEWFVTADWHNVDVFSASQSSPPRSNTTARTGSYSFEMGNARAFWMGVSSNATKYAGVGIYVTAASPSAFRINFLESSIAHVCIVINTTAGCIEVRRGSETGTLLGSGGVITTNRWYFIGIECTVHNSTGIVTVNLDGVQVIALTGQDTQDAGTGVINSVQLISGTNTCYSDDIKVRDDAIPDIGGIYVYVPTGDGADAAWTGSAGSDFQCVDDVPATYTDYIATDVATTGTKSTFTHAAMAAAAYDSIACVCSAAVAKLDASGAGNARAIVKSSASYGNGASVALSTTTKYLHVFATVNPDGGGAWDKTAVGAAEPGVETI